MTTLLLSPHDDDSALFAGFTCLREHPEVIVVADSYVQPARGEVGCSVHERARETDAAHVILGCSVRRLGLRDDELTLGAIIDALEHINRMSKPELVYVPALEGGHPHHDMTAVAAAAVFGADRLRCYSTYSRHSQYPAIGVDLHPVGTDEIRPTTYELKQKTLALQAYASQIRVNGPHFQAVSGRSEWLSGYRRVHLGCGVQLKPGWLNVDRFQQTLTDEWPELRYTYANVDLASDWHELVARVGESTTDYVFSEDVLEHIPPHHRVAVINQIWDILRPGGIMEHYVPNAGSENDYGSPTHLSHWNLQTFEHFNADSYRWKKDHEFEGIRAKFKPVSAEVINFKEEADGVRRAQSIHVRYRAVK